MNNDISTIYLVASWEQWIVLRDSGRLAPGSAIAAYDLDTVVDAADRGIPGINLFAFQEYARSKSHEKMSWAFCEQFAEILSRYYTCQGCDLLDRIKFDLAYPLMYALTAADVVGQCLRVHPEAEIRIFPQRQQAFIWDPGERPPDLFNAVAWWQAERMGFAPRPVAGPPPAPPKPSSTSWRAADSPLASTVEPVGTDSDDAPVTSCQVLSVGGFLEMAEQECALAYAAKNRRTDWFVASSDPLDSLPRFDPIHLWRLPAVAAELERALAGFKENALPLVRARIGTDYDVLLDNPHAAFFWNHVADLLRHGAMHCAAGRLLAEGLRPRVVLMGGDHLGGTRCLARGLADAGTCSVSIQHGGIHPGNFNYPNEKDSPNHLAVWNDEEALRLRPWRHEQSLLPVTGSFRADMHALKLYKPSDPVKGRRPRIVLLSIRLTDMFPAYFSSHLHHQVWLEVVRLCERHPDWDFVVKSHPRFRYQALHSTQACRRLSNLSLVEGKPLDVLVGASAAVMLTELSTVALDAMAAGVPVVWLSAAVIAPGRHGAEDAGVLVAKTVGALEDTLSRLLADEAFRSRMVADGQVFLEKTLPYTGDEAAARLCAFVDEQSAARSSPARPPDPSARWLLDLFDLLARAQAGQGTLAHFQCGMASLRKRNREVDVRRLDYLDVAELGGYILHAAVLCPWKREDIDLPGVVRLVYRSLPQTLRPPLSVLRNYWVHAYVEQGKRTPGWRCKLLPYLLAPGRLRSLFARSRAASFSRCARDRNPSIHGSGRENQD